MPARAARRHCTSRRLSPACSSVAGNSTRFETTRGTPVSACTWPPEVAAGAPAAPGALPEPELGAGLTAALLMAARKVAASLVASAFFR